MTGADRSVDTSGCSTVCNSRVVKQKSTGLYQSALTSVSKPLRDSIFRGFSPHLWEGRAAWWAHHGAGRLLTSRQWGAGSKIHFSLAFCCDPVSPIRPHLQKFAPPPNCKLCCDRHLITWRMKSESSWYNHFHRGSMHLD